jgi:L-rhamnose 1-dehydrogenase
LTGSVSTGIAVFRWWLIGTDVLVSNAGICPFHEFLSMPHAVWERTRSVNLDGSFYICGIARNHA